MLWRFRNLRLFPTPLVLCLLDTGLTLGGQPEAYWQGNSAAVREMSPEVHRLLAIHPAAFATGVAVYMAILAGLLLLLPRAGALFVAVSAAIGHTVGACTWLWLWERGGYQTGIGLCLVTAAGLVGSIWWEAPTNQSRVTESESVDQWAWVRWPLVALLATVPVYAFLWPH